MTNKLALTLASNTGDCQQLIDEAVKAEQLGYDSVWFADTGYPDPLTLAGQVAAATTSVDIGIAVVPAYTRTPAVLASSTATLNEISDGRFILGLGSSSQRMIENWHGLPFDKPLGYLRETVTLLRGMLAGEKSSFEGSHLTSKGFRIKPCEHPPRIYLAALRGKMLELAAEIGDGVVLNLFPESALPKMLEHIAIGAERGGKSIDDIDIVVRYQLACADDTAAEMDMFRAFYGPYYATPVYNKFLEWCGYTDVAAAIRAGWAAKDRERTAAAMTEALISEIAVIGDRDTCQARLRRDVAAGVNTVMITPVTVDDAKRTAMIDDFSPKAFTL